MTTLILELQPDLYDRLAQEAARPGQPGWRGLALPQ